MDIEKYKIEFTNDIEDAMGNQTLRMFYDHAISKLPHQSRTIIQIMIGIAYTEGKKDGFNPEKNKYRI